jgi:flagellum-specific ATP synthase
MNRTKVDSTALLDALERSDPVTVSGRVSKLVGLTVEADGLEASVGELCRIELDRSRVPVLAEVVGFANGKVLLMPFQHTDGIRPGFAVRPTGAGVRVPVGEALLGRVVDGLGVPVDGKGAVGTCKFRPTTALSPRPLDRQPIDKMLTTGIRAIDGCLACGQGQRMGVFSGSGVGKSTLLGMICRNANSDVNVVALIGERGREVKGFIENNLGALGLERTIVVVVTSDESPLMRIKGAETAMTMAEYFRDRGKNVVFIMDSVTRYAMALREVTLSAGEVPTSRGYTPSVFARLPMLLERAGTSDRGSITAFISVLVEGDEIKNDPITDAIRSILDGHVLLSRKLANSNIFPAIDLMQSISRLTRALIGKTELARLNRILDLLATYTESEDLINIGAYVVGTNPKIDEAIAKIDAIRNFIKQDTLELVDYDDTQKTLSEIAGV